MSPTLERLREDILALPTEERDTLIASVYGDAGEVAFTLHPAWKAELQFRSQEIEAGRMGSVSWEDYEKELDEPVEPS
jgi:putative addiction module component (TIGR02574 family)